MLYRWNLCCFGALIGIRQLAPTVIFLFGLTSKTAGTESLRITVTERVSTNLLLTAPSTADFSSVVLESKSDAGPGGWIPRQVKRGLALKDTLLFPTPTTGKQEVFRLRGNQGEPWPESVYGQPLTFETRAIVPNRAGFSSRDQYVSYGRAQPLEDVDLPHRTAFLYEGASTVIHLRGTQLFYLNPVSGLQAFDIARPGAPVLNGGIDLPVASQMLFSLGPDYAAILGRSSCREGATGDALVILDFRSPGPQVVASVPIDGGVRSARMINGYLCVHSAPIKERSGPFWHEWYATTAISIFDLREPARPQLLDQFRSDEGSLALVTGGNRLAVRGELWGTNRLFVLEVQENGKLVQRAELSIGVQPRWIEPIGFRGDLLLAEIGSWDSISRQFAVYSLAKGGLELLGQTELPGGGAENFRLIEGSRALFTYWPSPGEWGEAVALLDFAEPKAPRVLNSVRLPIGRTILIPRGDHVIAAGDGDGVEVFLFRLEPAGELTLLDHMQSRAPPNFGVAIGIESVRYVPELASLLVPLRAESDGNVVRGLSFVTHAGDHLNAQPLEVGDIRLHRAFTAEGRLWLLGEHQLIELDLSDQAKPGTLSATEPEWPVDFVFVEGNYLIQIGGTYDNYTVNGPAVRVSELVSPHRLVEKLTLPNLPILGVTRKGQRLLVLQGSTGLDNPRSGTKMSVISLAALPEVTLSGSAQGPQPPWTNARFIAAWPKSDVVVWMPSMYVGEYAGGRFWSPDFNEGHVGQLFTFELAGDHSVSFKSYLELPAPWPAAATGPFTTNGLVYSSHRELRFLEPTLEHPHVWREAWFLDVVDYTEPSRPALRPPAPISGPLRGIGHGGDVLFCLGVSSGGFTNEYDRLEAFAYDGVTAFRLDTAPLPTTGRPRPLLVKDRFILLGFLADSTGLPGPTLETWTLTAEGKLARVAALPLPSEALHLKDFDGMLAVQLSTGISLIDATDPLNLRLLNYSPPRCGEPLLPDFGDGSLATGLWLPNIWSAVPIR